MAANTLVVEHDRGIELDVAQERRQELDELTQKSGVHIPHLDRLLMKLLLGGRARGRGSGSAGRVEHLGHKDAMSDELEPSVGETGRAARPHDVIDVDERLQDVIEYGLEVVLGLCGLEQQHVEETMVRHALELRELALLVVEQAAADQAQHLVEQVDLVHVVHLVARVLHQQDDELDERVQTLIAHLTLTFSHIESS